MSGHGSFSAIDGVRPTLPTVLQPGGDIGVSPNKSVGGVNAPGASDAGGVTEEVPLDKTGDAAEKTGALVRQLDILLSRAAESATKGIDAASLKDTLNQVNLSKGDRKTMNAAADKADAAFKAINKFTGFQLAAAVGAKDGKFDWNLTNPAGEAHPRKRPHPDGPGCRRPAKPDARAYAAAAGAEDARQRRRDRSDEEDGRAACEQA